MTKIVIADDQALFREGLRTLLSTRSDMDVVGEASDGDEAVALVEKLQPAVVLMDLRMPRADDIQVTARIRKRIATLPAASARWHSASLSCRDPTLRLKRRRLFRRR